MKKGYLILAFVLPAVLQAQRLDTLTIDSLKKKTPSHYVGLYLIPGVELSPAAGGGSILSALGIGIDYQRWIFNVSSHNFQGDAKALIIFPNVYSLEYRYGQLLVGYKLTGHDWLSYNLIAAMSLGDLEWDKSDGLNFQRDKFSAVKIGALIGLHRFRYVKPQILFGYQRASGIDLTGLENDEFSDFFLGLGVRIGYFNQ